MTEIKSSAVLERILAKAREMGMSAGGTMTAERFLVALTDELNGVENVETELMDAQQVVKEYRIDLNKTKAMLLTFMDENSSMGFLDGIYMQKKIYEAKALAEQKGDKELTTGLLLSCILSDPSDGIKKGIVTVTNGEMRKRVSHTLRTDSELLSLLRRLEGVDRQTSAEEKPNKPVTNPTKGEMAELVADVKRIRSELQSCIFGQDNAINVFVTGYFQANMLGMLDKSRRRPRGTFLFAGPPGVGKTFMAEKAAEVLKLPFMRFDMSEYADKEANLEFCGSDKVYKSSKPGNVTDFVDKNPRCVLLFDEIEKAHTCVIHLFLQMLDAGRLRDNHTDKEVSFSQAIIILTTNAGRQLYEGSESGDFSAVSRKVIIKALERDKNPTTGTPFFPGAICSRFASGNVVMFNHIGAHNLRTIAKREIERHASNLEKETGIKIRIDERVYTALLFSEGSAADARTIRGRAETFFNDELYELLRLIAADKAKASVEEIEEIRIGVDLSQAKPVISQLFASPERAKILVFSDPTTLGICEKKTSAFDFMGVRDGQEALGIMKSQDIRLILLDMNCGAAEASRDSLNIEDVDSPARDFFKMLREQQNGIPVYLLEGTGRTLGEEEKNSFMRQGVRGVLELSGEREEFASRLTTIVENLHQQAGMIKLARENKLVSFETAQGVSVDGKTAEIKLFDFEMTIAVDSEDAKNVLSAVSKPNVRFEDVIGAEDAKKELTYFVDYLKDPKKYMGTGVKAPRGVLLYGPPGTGKTMLAKAMASEADVTFIAAEGNQFLKKFVGEGSEKVHELFKTARKYAPSILFIDEIDAIAKERKGGANAGASGEETLTAFLTEMDGFVNDPSKPVFVLAATNFDVEPGSDKSLDGALMRRFDRRVYIDLPNKEDRIRFLKMKIAKNRALDISEKQIENISMRATGMSLAALDSVVELALRSAIREGSTVVTDGILEEAFETFNGGEVKKWDVSQLERVARHEAGHALLCWMSGETPSYLTIVARGSHGGYMQHAEQEGKAIYTKDELLSRIRTSLGGRAAEIVYYGQRDGISTGASGDLLSATNIAQRIVCNYGMDESFGLAVVNGTAAGNGSLSVEIRNAVNRILEEQMEEATKLISENKDKIDALVKELMSKNHLNGDEINGILS